MPKKRDQLLSLPWAADDDDRCNVVSGRDDPDDDTQTIRDLCDRNGSRNRPISRLEYHSFMNRVVVFFRERANFAYWDKFVSNKKDSENISREWLIKNIQRAFSIWCFARWLSFETLIDLFAKKVYWWKRFFKKLANRLGICLSTHDFMQRKCNWNLFSYLFRNQPKQEIMCWREWLFSNQLFPSFAIEKWYNEYTKHNKTW